MKYLKPYLLLCILTMQVYSQQAVLTSRGTATGATGNLSFAIGQVDYGYYTNGIISITDGVQQTAQSTQSVCNGSKVSDLIAVIQGTNTKWYLTSTGGAPLPSTTLLSTKTYYMTQTINGIVSTRIAVDVTVDQKSVAGTISGASGTICYNSDKTLTLSPSHRGTVQWQYSITKDGPYNNIDGAIDTNLNTGNLTTTTYFRAVVTNGACSMTTTAPVKVMVYPKSLAGTIIGGDVFVCNGTNNTPLALVGYAGKIQWQYSNDNVAFYNIPSPLGNAFNYIVKNITNTKYYRVIVNNGGANCTPIITPSVAVNVRPAMNAGTISGTDFICYGTPATMIVSGYDEGATIQWQKASTLTGTYANLTTGVGFATHNYNTTSLISSAYFRAKVTFNGCSSTTASLLVTVQRAIAGKITGGTISTSTVCKGIPSILTLTGYTGPNIQWLSSNTTTATSFTPISGANSDNYQASNSAIGRIYYRASVTYSNCLPVLTPIVNLTVANCSFSKRISTITNNFEAMAYPNPFSNSFLIEINTPNPELVKISVYDMLGRMIEQRHAQDNTMEIGSNYQSGTYILKVSQGENQKTLQVIKK